MEVFLVGCSKLAAIENGEFTLVIRVNNAWSSETAVVEMSQDGLRGLLRGGSIRVASTEERTCCLKVLISCCKSAFLLVH